MSRFVVVSVVLAACGSPKSVKPDASVTGEVDAELAADSAVASDSTATDAFAMPVACTGTPLFPYLPMVPHGDRPEGSAIADLNGDGSGDLVTGGDTMTVAFGLGDGRFGPPTAYSVGAGYTFAVDVDGDLDLDLIVHSAVAQISVLKNAGNGTFGTPANYTTLASTGWVVTGDVDGDTDVDVVTANWLGGVNFAVGVMLNDGTGAFGAATAYAVGLSPTGLALGDVDGNGSRDILLTHDEDQTLGILRNNGNGTFQAMSTRMFTFEVNGLTTGDVNGDSNLDALINAASGTYLLLGNGNGTFGNPTQITASRSYDFTLADVDANGTLDLVTGSDSIAIFPGNGNGTFGAGKQYPGQYEANFALGQLNGDNKLDLVITGWACDATEVLLNDGTGGFRTWPHIPVVTGLGSVGSVVAGDFDHDGDLDIAASTFANTTQSVTFLLGDATGAFTVSGSVPVTGGELTAADINSDGRVDLVTSSGVLRAPAFSYTAVSTGLVNAFIGTVRTGDLNKDGRIDLVFSGSGLSVVLQTTSGYASAIVAGTSFSNVAAIADVNVDGNLDVITTDIDGTHQLWLGNGTGALQAPIAVGGSVFADFNGDGTGDLAGQAGVYLGNGNGTYGALLPFTLDPEYLVSIDALDFDRDGKLDLVALNGYGSLSVLRGNGNGTFQPRLIYTTGGQQTDIALGDFDHDGFPDAALAGYGADVSIFTQRGCVQ